MWQSGDARNLLRSSPSQLAKIRSTHSRLLHSNSHCHNNLSSLWPQWSYPPALSEARKKSKKPPLSICKFLPTPPSNPWNISLSLSLPLSAGPLTNPCDPISSLHTTSSQPAKLRPLLSKRIPNPSINLLQTSSSLPPPIQLPVDSLSSHSRPCPP